jgi:hypothetical protein
VDKGRLKHQPAVQDRSLSAPWDKKQQNDRDVRLASRSFGADGRRRAGEGSAALGTLIARLVLEALVSSSAEAEPGDGVEGGVAIRVRSRTVRCKTVAIGLLLTLVPL